MDFEFKLPDIGEGVVEGEIVKWLVKEGEAISEDQPMVEVMTDKATVEIPSPKAGKVTKLMFGVGSMVPVGATMIVIETKGNGASKVPTPDPAKPAAPKEGPARAARATDKMQGLPRRDAGKVQATPAVRRLAREEGVDLARIAGSGPAGRITRADVKAAAGGRRTTVMKAAPEMPTAPTPASGSAPAPTPAHAAGDQRVPLRGLRRRIAENMARSTQTAAHFTYVEECDVTDLVRVREVSKAKAAEQGVKLSFLPFIVRAVSRALRKFPQLNATLDEAASEIVYFGRHHIGVAAATQQGLVVPVVRDVDQKTLLQLGREIQGLGDRAKVGRLSPAELGGSTFTITSLGQLGGILATPIINFPEVAILGVHKIRTKPRYIDGQLMPRQIMNLSISLDHRLVDGHEGAMFLAELVSLLEDPFTLVELT